MTIDNVPHPISGQVSVHLDCMVRRRMGDFIPPGDWRVERAWRRLSASPQPS